VRIRRVRRDRFELRLPEQERDLLRQLCGDLRTLVAAEDPSTKRLFPPGYGDDRAASEAYASLVHDDLASGHLAAIETMESTMGETRLDADQAAGWLTALNEIRLVIGTQLDVTEELYATGVRADDPRASKLAVYEYLGWLQEQLVEALAAGLPAAGTERA